MCGESDEEPAVWRWDEFQRGPPSESGEGMNREGGGITVVAVLADEALESEVGKDPGMASCMASRGMSCWGCAPPDDGSEEDEGGEGRRADLSLAEERFGLFVDLVLFSDDGSSRGGRLGVWLCVADARRGLAVGRGAWWDWDWASLSRDRLTDRLW